MAKTAAKASTVDAPKSSSSPKTAKAEAAPSALPDSIVAALPTGAEIIKHVQAIEALLPKLKKDLDKATKGGAVALARAFVVFHRLNERMLSQEKSFKDFKSLYSTTKELTFPQVMEAAGIDNVPLAEGFRVGVSHVWRASVKPGQKEAAMVWLEENEMRDIITEVINASTLSALAKELHENQNKDLPEEIFTAAQLPNTSVTKTK